MAVDISTELYVLDHSKSGAEIKKAIWDALYRIGQAEPSKNRGLDIGSSCEFAWGTTSFVSGIAEEEVI